MNSPGHRENLLSADYTQVGLGLALGTPADQTWGATYTTDFGAGASAPAPAHAARQGAVATRKKASPRGELRAGRLRPPQRALGQAARVHRLRPHGAGPAPLSI